MAKMRVQFPVEEKETRLWEGKTVCDVILKADNGMGYVLTAFKDGPAWNWKVGEEVEVDIKTEATVSTRGRVTLPRQNRGGGYGGGRPAAPTHPPVTAEFEQEMHKRAALAAKIIANLYKQLDATMCDPADVPTVKPDSRDLAAMASTVFISIYKP